MRRPRSSRKTVQVACPLEQVRVHLVPATTGDHAAIYRLLLSVGQAPSPGEFQHQLEYPQYHPGQRLLLRRGNQLLGHVRTIPGVYRFGPLQLPFLQLADLALLPEYRLHGYAASLLEAAEHLAARLGARGCIARTQDCDFFQQRHGWFPMPGHCYSTAGAREILSELAATEPPRAEPFETKPRPQPLNIRLWRHVELEALMRLYESATEGTAGALARTPAYWRWLINRRGYDRVYVVLEGAQKLGADDANSSIVGYAVADEGRIAELVTAPGQEQAARQLLARACGDAIERDFHTVRLDAPAQHPLHSLFQAARGSRHRRHATDGHVLLAKLFDPMRMLSEMRSTLFENHCQAGGGREARIGLSIDGEKYCVEINQRQLRIGRGQLGRSYLACSSPDLAQLILGAVSLNEAVQQERVLGSTRIALEAAAAILPKVSLWIPPWDQLGSKD